MSRLFGGFRQDFDDRDNGGFVNLGLFPDYKRIFLRQLRRKAANRTIPCPLCGARRHALICKSPNVHMTVFREIFAEKVVRCASCGFVFTNPRPSAGALERYYTEDYALEGLPVPKTVEQFLGVSYKEIWFSKDRDLKLILENKSSGRLLDVGCASGTLLWLAKQKGFRVQGIEVGFHSAEFVRSVLGIEVFCGQLETARFPDDSFDVITMIHALEHVPFPRVVVREIHRILAPNAVFIAVVPNYSSWSSERFGAEWIWLQPQNHYSHFTPDSLTKLFALEGLACTIRSEEGRYGEAEIRKVFSECELPKIFRQLKGSELIAFGQKSA
jgi:2-polyprenyl-3-methyl-5-hydroxy-6-metoxy-1,4-benzoquinol methylase